MKIPKAYVHVKNMYAIAPTKEQLADYCHQHGFDSIEDALQHFQGMWEPFLLEWFNSLKEKSSKQETEKNIYCFITNYDDEIVDLMEDEEWADISGENKLV